MNQNKIEILLKGLENQWKLYEKLRDVMKRELDSLTSSDQNSLVSLLKEKLSIMQNLEEEDTMIAEIKAEWKNITEKDSNGHNRIQTLLKNMEELLKEILETDRFPAFPRGLPRSGVEAEGPGSVSRGDIVRYPRPDRRTRVR